MSGLAEPDVAAKFRATARRTRVEAPPPHRDPVYIEASAAAHAAHMAYLTANLAYERHGAKIVQLQIELAKRNRTAQLALFTAAAAGGSLRQRMERLEAMELLEAEVKVARGRLAAAEATFVCYPADEWGAWQHAEAAMVAAFNLAQERCRGER